jgi:TonB family protein
MASSVRLALAVVSLAVVGVLVLGRLTDQRVVYDPREPPADSFAATPTFVSMPTYPPESVKRRSTGVGVALLAVGANGRVVSVSVLEAPDREIAGSMRAALTRWAFQPLPSGATSTRHGRVILYFALENGKGVVLTPQQALR